MSGSAARLGYDNGNAFIITAPLFDSQLVSYPVAAVAADGQINSTCPFPSRMKEYS